MEKELHKQCEALLKKLCISYLHLPKGVNKGYSKTNQLKGFPDFAIFLKGAETIFVELKTEKGRLNMEQEAYKTILERLGYSFYVCRSLSAFESIIYFHCKELICQQK